MAHRGRFERGPSKRNFANGAKTHRKNRRVGAMRGGIRL